MSERIDATRVRTLCEEPVPLSPDGPGNQERRIRRMIESGAVKGGRIYELEVFHANWCAVYDCCDRDCDCDPTILLDGERMEVAD